MTSHSAYARATLQGSNRTNAHLTGAPIYKPAKLRATIQPCQSPRMRAAGPWSRGWRQVLTCPFKETSAMVSPRIPHQRGGRFA